MAVTVSFVLQAAAPTSGSAGAGENDFLAGVEALDVAGLVPGLTGRLRGL
jgi:hypothetical protein